MKEFRLGKAEDLIIEGIMENAKEDELLPKEVGLAIQTNNVRYGAIL